MISPSLHYCCGTPSHQSNKPQNRNVWLDLMISLVQSYLEDLIVEVRTVSVQFAQASEGKADSLPNPTSGAGPGPPSPHLRVIP